MSEEIEKEIRNSFLGYQKELSEICEREMMRRLSNGLESSNFEKEMSGIAVQHRHIQENQDKIIEKHLSRYWGK